MSNDKSKFDPANLNPKQAEHIYYAAKGAFQALKQLDALSTAILNKIGDDNEHSDLYNLASLASFHSEDQTNVLDCMIEQVEIGEVK